LGVAYKPNIDDARESPALEILDITAHKGGIVSYNDPYIESVQTKHALSLHSTDLTAEILENVDCVVLSTNHTIYDVDFIRNHSRLIVDLRNMIKENSDNVYKL